MHLRPPEASAAAHSNYAVVLLLLVYYVSPPQGRETLFFYPVCPSDCPSQIVSNLVNATTRTVYFSRSDDVHDVFFKINFCHFFRRLSLVIFVLKACRH